MCTHGAELPWDRGAPREDFEEWRSPSTRAPRIGTILTSDERKALLGSTDPWTADLSCEASILWGRRVRAAIDRRNESVKEGEEDSRRRFPMRESPNSCKSLASIRLTSPPKPSRCWK
jgi:hypothetical protein